MACFSRRGYFVLCQGIYYDLGEMTVRIIDFAHDLSTFNPKSKQNVLSKCITFMKICNLYITTYITMYNI